MEIVGTIKTAGKWQTVELPGMDTVEFRSWLLNHDGRDAVLKYSGMYYCGTFTLVDQYQKSGKAACHISEFHGVLAARHDFEVSATQQD